MISNQTSSSSGLLYLSLCVSLALCFFVGFVKLFKHPHFLSNRRRRLFATEENRAHTTRGCLLSALFILPIFKHVLSPYLLISLGLLYSFIFVPLATGVFPSNAPYLKSLALRVSSYISNGTLDLRQKFNNFLIKIISYYIISSHFQNVVASELFTYIYCCVDGRFDSKRATFQLKLSLIFGIFLLIQTRKLDTQIREYIRKVGFSWSGIRHLIWMVLSTMVIIDGSLGVLWTFASEPTFSIVNSLFFISAETNFEGSASGDHPIIRIFKRRKFTLFQELESLWIPAVVKSLPILMSLLGIILGLTSPMDHCIKTKVILILPASFFCIYNPLRSLRRKYLLPLQNELAALTEGHFPPPTPAQLSSYGATCPICMDTLGPASRALPCSHIFHSFCINTALKASRLCPVCRRAL